jgi:hypothetical protein
VIVPIVREGGIAVPGGVFASLDPVALLIEEGGEWSFVPVEEGFRMEEIGALFPARDLPADPENL